MLIFKYGFLQRDKSWDVDARKDAKNLKRWQRQHARECKRYLLAISLYQSAVKISSLLTLKNPLEKISRWAMSGMLDRASSLLACSDWDVFKSAYQGDQHKAQDGYTLFLSTGELPPEVMNYIDGLPCEEETYL